MLSDDHKNDKKKERRLFLFVTKVISFLSLSFTDYYQHIFNFFVLLNLFFFVYHLLALFFN